MKETHHHSGLVNISLSDNTFWQIISPIAVFGLRPECNPTSIQGRPHVDLVQVLAYTRNSSHGGGQSPAEVTSMFLPSRSLPCTHLFADIDLCVLESRMQLLTVCALKSSLPVLALLRDATL